MMMRKVLPALACLAMFCAVAQAGPLFDVLNGEAETGYSAITPTYEYDMATELTLGQKLNTDGWRHNAPLIPSGDGLVTALASDGTSVKSYNSDGSSWWANRPNDGNWSFSLPAETKVVEIDFVGDFTENNWCSVGIGSSLNGPGEIWDMLFGITDGGWTKVGVRGSNFYQYFSGGVIHGWSAGTMEYQLLWDMENHAYKMDGYGNTGTVHSSGWQSIPAIDWGAVPSAYSRTPDELDVITFTQAPGNGVISYQVTALGVPVPEPGTLMLLGMGLSGLVFYGWRRRK